jgi:hypothetical protein
MLAWAIRYAFLFAYGNGGDLSFMLIIVPYGFVMISFLFEYIPTQKRVKNIKVLQVSLH